MKQTKLVEITDIEKQKGILEEAGRIIRHGGLVVFPTETVYGIGANGLDADACRSIYVAKGRPSDNPLILTVPDDIDYNKIVKEVFESLTSDGGLHLWVIPTEQLADVLKFLMCHPRFQGNLLDMDDEDPWDMPSINFENLCAEAENQFLSNQPINVVFEYKDADTGLVVHRITLNERDFWFFVDEQQMKIADRRW